MNFKNLLTIDEMGLFFLHKWKEKISQNCTLLLKEVLFILFVAVLFNFPAKLHAADLRRPVSPDQPMWLIHIDTWNYPDPQKIIDLVPEDIRPYVVMNISLSVSNESGRFVRAEYGYETAKSWLRTCAQNNMWAMVQPSSGAYSHFPDNDMTIFEELYQDYPNLIGFNYCEQSWGYGDDNPLAYPWGGRITHFATLLELNNRYGGYLVVSWCGNQWTSDINPIAMLKRDSDFEAACSNYTENYILCEKYTFKTYQNDMESVCLGAYLSGYSGQYGLRYDDSGWTDKDGNENQNFTMATYGAPFLEHVMLTGQTVIDGPELIWRYCFRELSTGSTTDGYTTRRWDTYPQFDNVSVDLFRKVIDGTVRIPTRQEVIDRTKVVIINDVNSGSNDDKYSSPETLFEGLYRMDGNYTNNKSFFKKTGRYPTIPTVYRLDDGIANSFDVKVNRSGYSSRWTSISSKVTEFNNRFPQESTGDIYAGRHENGWVVYNPFKTGETANGNIQFKYNTCSSMDLSLSQYTAGVVKEYSNKVDIYLSNYDTKLNTELKTDVIKIYGSSSIPTYTFTDRGNDKPSDRWSNWSDGVWTLTIYHNGPVDVSINCSGSATGRLTQYSASNIVAPASPPDYTGPLQYEAETFDYKNIAGIVKSAYSENIRDYTGQGYLKFGTNSAAAFRDHITVLKAGPYVLKTKYTVTGGNINSIDLYVNGAKVATPSFTVTSSLSNWAEHDQTVELNAGENIIEFKANATGAHDIYFDNITVASDYANDIWLDAECGVVGSLWQTLQSATAAKGGYVKIADGNNSTGSAPSSTDGHITYGFSMGAAGDYSVWARVRAANYNDDSFWVRMDNGSWYSWNNIGPYTEWAWEEFRTFNLSAGNHTLTIAYREDGAHMDKIYIGNGTPYGQGTSSTNCDSNNPPVANAGPDQTAIDSDNSGSETVNLDGSGSSDSDGTLASYAWSIDGNQVATGQSPSVSLNVGVHIITLTVTDNRGATDTDEVTITITPPAITEIWLDAECGQVGSLWQTLQSATAAKGGYVKILDGNNSTGSAPSSTDGHITYDFSMGAAGDYSVWARVRAANYNDDSFWVRMDNGNWYTWNGIGPYTEWAWEEFRTFNLSAGSHTLTIAYREDGAHMDKIYIGSETPSGYGTSSNNCNNTASKNLVTMTSSENQDYDVNIFPNPANSLLIIDFGKNLTESANLVIYDYTGRKILEKEITSREYILDVSSIHSGTYIIRFMNSEINVTKRFIKK